MKNIAFIINPMSGTQNKRRLPKIINEWLDDKQWLASIEFTDRPRHATYLAKQYATMGFDVVVAVGGDGTVQEVATALIGSSTALAVLPMGTTNSLARHLGVPSRLFPSMSYLNRVEVIHCDLLRVRETGLICVSSMRIDDTASLSLVAQPSSLPLEGKAGEGAAEVAQTQSLIIANCRQQDIKDLHASIQDGLITICADGKELPPATTVHLHSDNEISATADGNEITLPADCHIDILVDALPLATAKRY